MKGLFLKKMALAVLFVLILGSSVSASVILEFASTIGGTPASTYNASTNMNIALGDMDVINTSGGLLDGVIVEISDISIESKLIGGAVSIYDVEPVVDVMGVNFYTVFLGDTDPTLILSADLSLDTMLVVGASATIDGSVSNITLHNAQEWGQLVPEELVTLQTANIADLVINLSASGYNIAQYIDTMTPIPTMTVHGTMSPEVVPEPSVVFLFLLGCLWAPFRKKTKAA